MIDFSLCEQTLGVTFRDKTLLLQAFTHRSYLNENKTHISAHNERLEFLGDAVLELVATQYLFLTFPDKAEGELTSIRAAIVNTNSLAETASALGMNDFLLLSKGEAKDTGRARQYILANTYEAFVGALYIDQGYDACKDFISRTLIVKVSNVVETSSWQDSKSLFQEKAQERTGHTPEYRTLKEVGPDHAKRFTAGVYINGELIVKGEGFSKQEAEAAAAQEALKKKGWS